MEEGIFPSNRSLDVQSEIEEERRLCYVGVTRAKENLFLTCSKMRTIYGSTSYNLPSRFIDEIPNDLLDGYDNSFDSNNDDEDESYTWKYGTNKIKSYSYGNNFEQNHETNSLFSKQTSFENRPAFGRSAESFLSGLGKREKKEVDLSKYHEGIRIYHKKFGEGTITKTEPEGDDLKVDIDFDKAGHKRLMARFANLEII